MLHHAWILTGATATGKSSVCQFIAERMNLKILSADSMMVYKGMDIGTAKPSAAERGNVPYFGIDMVTPDRTFSTGAWLREIKTELRYTETSPEKPLIVTGGTGLYIKALVSGIESEASDPEVRRQGETILDEGGIEALRSEIRKSLPDCPPSLIVGNNPRRLIRTLEQIRTSGSVPDNWKNNEDPVIITLGMERKQLYARILRRVETMFRQGLLDEVRNLRKLYPAWSDTARKAIGYEEALAVLDGVITQDEAVERISQRTRRLAKRQETWFRHQHKTVRHNIDDGDCIEITAEKVLNLWQKYGSIKINI
ncbi:MAG: tRNA (adenosine(37)-N6)-dimethylallyltransferase MiaA [Kiritimatiellia bacterium]